MGSSSWQQSGHEHLSARSHSGLDAPPRLVGLRAVLDRIMGGAKVEQDRALQGKADSQESQC